MSTPSPSLNFITSNDAEDGNDDNDIDPFVDWKGGGYCCFCNEECNPASQSCGACPRNGYAFYRTRFNR
jgi:hypothetical protein